MSFNLKFEDELTNEEKYNDEPIDRMPYGRFKNKLLVNLSLSYQWWVYENTNKTSPLYEAIFKILKDTYPSCKDCDTCMKYPNKVTCVIHDSHGPKRCHKNL